jgi:NADH dehydrogenase
MPRSAKLPRLVPQTSSKEDIMKQVVVVGGGFAGLWAAAAAARRLDEAGGPAADVSITLVNRDPWHVIRVRAYEQDLSDTRIALADVLDPIGVELVVGEVSAIDAGARVVRIGPDRTLSYDRLVLAPGSQLQMPDIPGLASHAFSVDTYLEAERLNRHLVDLPHRPASPGHDTVLVVGAGLTGIEAACEMPEKLKRAGMRGGRVIIADHRSRVGSDMGEEARPVIETALHEMGIESRTGIKVEEADAGGVTLAGGERIATETLVWAGGMRANPLAAMLPVERDRLGRLPVDEYMRVKGVAGVFAAGDVAAAVLDGTHTSVMSCQHGRPMGRFAGTNAAADLLGLDMLPLRIEHYVTCLDLGPWGALYTEGWDRRLAASGAEAKKIKQTINCVRIYPPRTRDRRAILDAAAPVVQAPPLRRQSVAAE